MEFPKLLSASAEHVPEGEVVQRIYEYPAKLDRIIDGDTIVVIVNLGFDIEYKTVLRLQKINAPEVVGSEKAEGMAAEEALKKMLDKDVPLWIRTVRDKKGKFGRYLACLYQPTLWPTSLNEQMVAQGYAEYVEY